MNICLDLDNYQLLKKINVKKGGTIFLCVRSCG